MMTKEEFMKWLNEPNILGKFIAIASEYGCLFHIHLKLIFHQHIFNILLYLC